MTLPSTYKNTHLKIFTNGSMSVYEQLCTYLPPLYQPNINSEFTLSCSQLTVVEGGEGAQLLRY